MSQGDVSPIEPEDLPPTDLDEEVEPEEPAGLRPTEDADVPRRPGEAGIPDHADDDSTAYEDPMHPSVRAPMRDSPPAMPSDSPQGVDETGVTAVEQREGEPLDERLAREEPDVSVERAPAEDRRRWAAERGAEEAALREEGEAPAVPEEDVPFRP